MPRPARSPRTDRRRRRVALLIESSNAYARGLLRGVRSYVREHGRWATYLLEQGRGERPPAWIAKWRGDGIIARIENRAIARAVRTCGAPVVDVSAARLLPSAPWVETDDDAISSTAARHLLDRGFRHFAYCGDARFNWSRWRCERFVAALRAAGFDCRVFDTDAAPRHAQSDDPERQQRLIAGWLRTLPRPVGVMACYDIRGRQVIDACRAIGAAVPDEVAVVGVDNDELLCDLCDPPLSSVTPDSHRTGYTAAALLDRMMSGRDVPAEGHLIAPLGVATRRSTDVLAIDDADISAAVRYIRDHACDGISVEDLLDHVPMSRRVFEHRFKTLLGRTPHQEIARLQIERATQLLRETDLPLSTIAPRAGFRHVEYFSAAFKRQVGMPPSHYRSRHRA